MTTTSVWTDWLKQLAPVISTITRLSAAFLLLLVAAPLATAQPTGIVYRVGYLGTGSATRSQYLVDSFREGLRELGWVEGKNVVVDYRFAQGKFDRLPALAAELVRRSSIR